MQYTNLGNSGLQVSRIALGGMSFGHPTKNLPWTITGNDAHEVIKTAVDNGINFFDTANVYAYGDSERILGKELKQMTNRDEIVVATKVYFAEHDRPNLTGLSRKAIMSQIDQSLERLGMDYVDLYIIHRWDYNTPIEETMEALNDIVKSGKARYIGASAMFAWQFEKAQAIAEKHGWHKFISMQNHYNLLYREEEREMVPLAEDQNIGLTPYSPLAGGRLAHPWGEKTKRSSNDPLSIAKYGATEDVDHPIVERVEKIAKKYNLTMSQVALAWLLHQPQVVAPIVGGTKVKHLQDAIDAVDIKLAPEDLSYLQELYVPHRVVGPLTKKQAENKAR